MPDMMSVSFTVLDNDIPAINFCSEFSIPITQKTFCKSFITYYDNDLKFRIAGLSTNCLNLKWYDNEEHVLEVYFKKDFMGYVLVGDLYNAITHCYQFIEESFC